MTSPSVLPSANSRPRILVLSVPSGAGHTSAALAVERALAARGDCFVEHVNALDYCSPFYQFVFNRLYRFLIGHFPHGMGWIFRHFDRPWHDPALRRVFSRLNCLPLLRFLRGARPDLCIATHFLASTLLADWMRRGKLSTRLSVVVTDFDAHPVWLSRGVARYYVALEETAQSLVGWDIPQDSIRVTGIPVNPVFAATMESDSVLPAPAVRRSLGIAEDRQTVLLSAGSFGIGPSAALASSLLALRRPWQIVAAAGRSTQLEVHLRSLAERAAAENNPATMHVLGFTNEMHRWMAASDIILTKAGGLTVSESLSLGLPLAIIEPLPGVETRNADHLLEHGAAIRCNNLHVAAWKVARLLDDPARLAQMRVAARTLGRPGAAAEIAADSLALFHPH